MQEERKTPEMRAQMTDIERLRHSTAHVLATAILKIWPGAQFAAGPPVDNGFYYDVDLPHRISTEDFEKIEAEMKKEVKANHPFERVEVSRDEALDLGKKGRLAALSDRNDPSKFKLDIIENIPPGETISLYRNGDFIDLCAGPHVMRTGNIGAFKLTTVASAYYVESMFPPMTLLEEKHRKILENLKIARARFSASFDAASEHTWKEIQAELASPDVDEAKRQDISEQIGLLNPVQDEDREKLARIDAMIRTVGDNYYLKAM